MLIGIIAASNLRKSPYVRFYTSILEEASIPYEIILPNRLAIEESYSGCVHVLPWNKQLPAALNYFLYTKKAKRIISQRHYDALIIMTSMNAVCLHRFLKKQYAKRYILDIRDYAHENIPLYFHLEEIAVKNALMNVVSSRQFIPLLPKGEYAVCHNYYPPENEMPKPESSLNGVIRIGYLGSLSHVEQCIKLMQLVSRDKRFSLDFYGHSDAEDILKQEAKKLTCENIRFHGAYTPKEKDGILQNVDILFNLYGNDTKNAVHSLSNKLYDALTLVKPLLASPDTYTARMAGPLAYTLDLETAASLDGLCDWYNSRDKAAQKAYAAQMIVQIARENRETQTAILHALLPLHENSVEIFTKEGNANV